MRRRVIVFGKAPQPGRVKTRLIPHLGGEGAARLHAQLLRRALRVATDAAIGPVELCTDDWNDSLEVLARGFALERSRQGEGDLGARMARALARTPGALLIGTDSVALDPGYLRRAADALDRHDAVFAPTEDGGYLLVGMVRVIAAAFEGISWSTDRVLAQTRSQLAAVGATWSELGLVWDIDRPEDYERMLATGIALD